MLLPKTKPILVGILYRPPDQSKFLDKLSTAISRSNNFDNQEVYILGDVNFHIINKQKHIPNGIKRYKEFCSLYGLEQLISTPTRVTENSSSILAHILTDSTDRVSQFGVVDTGLSDHQLIYCTRKVTRTKFNSHKNITIRSLKNYNQDVYSIKSISLTTENLQTYVMLKPRPNELNISLNFTQQMFSNVACCSVMFSRVGGQTG